jgi:hypothetical protein
MLRNKWYGFPGWDVSVVLRLVIDILPEQIDFIYDLTDLILGGYFNIDDDFANFSSEYNKEYDPDGKIIVLTEWKTDSYFLSESLSLFYPHLEDYFSFMDFDAARVGGGAGSLANIVKSFSGAGIINKVIAIFDNDTAAHSALRSLRKAKIAKNIKIMTLPEIKILESYPTLGPTGMVLMNVNGLAGSIETYLGEQSLRNVQGEYHPIQWTGFESGLKKYQGEITEKETIQNKFIEQLNLCKRDKSLITNYDWTGIETILKGMFEMFHSEDEQIILSKADE